MARHFSSWFHQLSDFAMLVDDDADIVAPLSEDRLSQHRNNVVPGTLVLGTSAGPSHHACRLGARSPSILAGEPRLLTDVNGCIMLGSARG